VTIVTLHPNSIILDNKQNSHIQTKILTNLIHPTHASIHVLHIHQQFKSGDTAHYVSVRGIGTLNYHNRRKKMMVLALLIFMKFPGLSSMEQLGEEEPIGEEPKAMKADLASA
jgi:hypothetical protein